MASFWPPKQKKNQQQQKQQKRQWIAHNIDCFDRVDVAKIPNSSGNDYVLYMKVESLPTWKIKYKKDTYSMNTQEFFNILEDTMVEYVPCGLISWDTNQNQPHLARIRVKSIRISPTKIHKLGIWEMAFDIRLPKGETICSRLSDVKIQLRSRLLPTRKYQYGYCNLIHAKYNKCSDSEYLTRPGTLGTHHKYKRCQVFKLTPGDWTPKIVCRFDVGT